MKNLKSDKNAYNVPFSVFFDRPFRRIIDPGPTKLGYFGPPIRVSFIACHDDPGNMNALSIQKFLLHLFNASGNYRYGGKALVFGDTIAIGTEVTMPDMYGDILIDSSEHGSIGNGM